MMRTLLIDADVLVYRVGLSLEQSIHWGNDIWTCFTDYGEAQAKAERWIDDVKKELNADRVVLALSSPTNFRKKVMPEYKSNRKNKRKPNVFVPLREFFQQEYECFMRDGLEGDDVLGILSTHPRIIKGERIIVSVDKDMATIPGKWVNDGRAREAIATLGEGTLEDYIRTITPEQADFMHMLQTLSGDASDGYAGVPGVGMTTAEKLLLQGEVLEPYEHTFKSGPRKGVTEKRWGARGKKGTPWQIVVSVYASAGLSEEVALQNARVARICQHQDWDFKKGRVRLWNPPA